MKKRTKIMLKSMKYFEKDYYGGSHTFTWLADLTGLRLDLVNFIVCQITALFLASLFRSVLHPSKVSSNVRHIVALTLGLCFGCFCYGPQAIHIVCLPAICYIVIRTQNPQVVQRYVLIVAMTYLLSIHLVRLLYDHEPEALDITAPLMIITQKVTSLAFSMHDGFVRPAQELTKAQQYHAIRKVPSTLEYFSYVLHFHGLLAGPVVFYRDYIDFMEGTNLLKYSIRNTHNNRTPLILEPSPIKPVAKKVFGSLMCALIFIKFSKLYPVKIMKEDDFIENTHIIYKLWYAMMSTTFVRFKYYHAWLLADAICNNSGLGFTGYDKDGNANWDLISNINIFGFEFAANMRDAINHWNCGTNRWLRNIVYERVPKEYGTILTFALSAIWHGFYPGYYLTFATGALMVTSARKARRIFRYRFQRTQFTRMLYDILTCLTTRIVMGYTTFPFVILEFMGSIKLYLKFYLCLHILALAVIYILPKCITSENCKTVFNSITHKNTNAKAVKIRTNKSDSTTMVTTTPLISSDTHLQHRPNEIFKRILVENNINNKDVNHYEVYKNQDVDELIFEKHQNNQNQNNLNNYKSFNAETKGQQQQHMVQQLEEDEQHLKQMAARDVIHIKHDLCEMEQLSSKLMEKLEAETKHIEEFIDRTVNETVSGLVEFKRDLMRDCSFKRIITTNSGNGGNTSNTMAKAQTTISTSSPLVSMTPLLATNDENSAFLKKEIDAINAVVQQTNVLPAVLSNGHAK